MAATASLYARPNPIRESATARQMRYNWTMRTDTPYDVRLSVPVRVNELFKSIQGESTWAGLPCTFVRLTGCHLRCTWCDTPYAYNGGEVMPVGEVIARVEELGTNLVEVTGGEPLLQDGCIPLIEILVMRGHIVLVETSGTVPIHHLPVAAIKIMDLKCPSSGVCEQNDFANIEALSPCDEVKFVLADRADYEWSRGIIRRYNLARRCKQVLLSTVHGQLDPADVVHWMLEDNLPARFQLQLHKYIWPPNQQGV